MAFKVTSTYTGKRDHDFWVDADSAEDFRLKYVITPFTVENYDPWSWQHFMDGNEDFTADKDNIVRQREPQNISFDTSTQVYTVEHIYDSEGSYDHINDIMSERKVAIGTLCTQYTDGLYSDAETAEFNSYVNPRVDMYTKTLLIDSDYSG